MKDFDFSLNTTGMRITDRFKILDEMLIPIGTKCYAVRFNNIEEIEVDASNQRLITMFYNSTYFLNKEDAEKSNNDHNISNEWLNKYLPKEV